MCSVSMIADHYRDKWQQPSTYPSQPGIVWPGVLPPPISREEFDRLKADVKDMKKLLHRAKKYDEETGQRDCENEEKMKLLRLIAERVGVDLELGT